MTVGALHDAIHAIGGEASFIKEQFQYISSQVCFGTHMALLKSRSSFVIIHCGQYICGCILLARAPVGVDERAEEESGRRGSLSRLCKFFGFSSGRKNVCHACC